MTTTQTAPARHTSAATHRRLAVGGADSLTRQNPAVAQAPHASEGPDIPADQLHAVTQVSGVGGDSDHPRAIGHSAPKEGSRAGDPPGGGGEPPTTPDSSPRHGSSLADPALSLAADIVDDLERTRIANKNRLGQLTRGQIDPATGELKNPDDRDKDGVIRGFGIADDHPDVAQLRLIVEGLAKIEHQADLNLQRIMRRHPLYPWVQAHRGVGTRQAARLLATIGDPYLRETAYEDGTYAATPRTVSQLWAYTGYHTLDGGAARRKRGERANWSSVAKSRAYLIAEACMKSGSNEYRDLYDERRAATEDRAHARPCPQCGKKGAPAEPGTPWRPGHQHADALRVVAKRILRDLWRAARDHHEAGAA